MIIPSRLLFVFAVTLFVSGCSAMVPLHEVRNSYIVDGSLTKDQLKEAIIKGAQTTDWLTKDLVGDKILATYRIRDHTVHLEISYTDYFYVTRYKATTGMKMFCTVQDKLKDRNIKISGQQGCLGDRAPMYIDGNYKKWVNSLNASIQNSLASM